MVLNFSLLTTLSSLFCFTRSSAELISSLPGQPANISFKQYSGYIVTDAQHGRALFYYFVEADSIDPLSRPLTVWLNGGPGCSSLGFGAFMEHGPFQPGNDGNLQRNKYSWNKVSNMLYVESPIGVGFSYSNTSSDYIGWDDARTAWDNMQFLINWFKKFPKYRDSDLYLTGESYAGHYIPHLALLLLEYNRQPHVKPLKLKAIALGNPLLDIEISVNAAEFLWSHGVISDEMLTLKRTLCNDSRYLLEYFHKNVSQDCKEMITYMKEEVGNDTDSGDLLMPICLSSTGIAQSVYVGDLPAIHAKLVKKIPTGDPCLGDRIYAYLNNPQVQEALHVKTNQAPSPWNFCSGPLQYQIQNAATNIIPLLSDILQQHVPILLYSGDQDSKIPLTQTRKIANMLAHDLALMAFGRYGPWYDGLQIAGWSQSFGQLRQGKNITYLTFATVRGAAHEVPFTSPSQALTLFQTFLEGKENSVMKPVHVPKDGP